MTQPEEHFVETGGARIYTTAQGPSDGPAVVFANALGTDLSLWDAMLPHLPAGLRLIRWDKRGHGRSSTPGAPYSMGKLVGDAEAVCDHWGATDTVFVGLSIGGLIAQGLAVKRPDLIRALVLSNTAAKLGTKDMWQDRIAAIEALGLEPMADMVMKLWFGPTFRAEADMDHWRALLISTRIDGYKGCCAAISGTDFYASTAALRIPTLCLAGSDDSATPPDLVRETTDLVPGSQFHLFRGAGHLPCAEQPEQYAEVLGQFLRNIGHI